jgi:hypothetical protein
LRKKNKHKKTLPHLSAREGFCEDMDEMTAPELNAFLENLARLIEAVAATPEDAARLVRESKIKA